MEDSMLGGGGDEEPPFIYRWCDKYGLSDDSAAVLFSQGFCTVQELTALTSDDIKELGLPMSQRLLLRGALLQFKENDLKYAERRSRKLGLPVEQTLFLTKNAVLDLQNRPAPPPRHSDVPSVEELEKRTELRRRLRKKKQRPRGGMSLADQILNQRRHMAESSMGGSEVSLMSASSSTSSSSMASSSTLPTGHVTEPNPTTLRETRSAADINKNNNNNDINKCIEEILKDEPPKPPKSRPVSRSSGTVSRSSVTATAQARAEEEALVSKMDEALDRLLTEITDGVPAGAAKEVKNPKGDLKAAMDILDKDILTDEERAMLKAKKP